MTLTEHQPELDELDIHSVRRYVEDGYPWQAWDLLREYAASMDFAVRCTPDK